MVKVIFQALRIEHTRADRIPAAAGVPGRVRRTFRSHFCEVTGSTAQSGFSNAGVSAVRFMAFANRSCSSRQGELEISRFSCML
jgi:hypothetical protein